ncbi:Rv2578c family radical SAM protein [Actinospica durhamensis]|uniref:Rv2578c family radical SAM protein n=1 Tax=Actinospica durhamensis TaxID=1508375 RepID=A0A941ESJ6_9ACTN|nr:Rv2578c family radical SAM protein [Actinospica durhamensis]MBR7836536.1 Rv2578c family radical SAM protein [Actinospica durhamensis]
MRWSGQLVDGNEPAQEALFDAGAVVRTFDTPGFRGTTFYEVRAKSVLNRVTADAWMFNWTINPYRGCGHRCTYCFARKTHTYLDFDAGLDFDTRIVVKVNAPEVLRRELARPSWRREPVAMGTNVDCYQRAEGRYRLMPEIISALAASGTPLSILTKGTLMLRDLPLLLDAARDVPVSLSMSIGFLDRELWRTVEAGTPSPARRLDAVRTLADSGLGCSVLMAPILPYLSDSPEQLRACVKALADAGARSITPLVLHLRPGAREWYFSWLQAHHPQLVPRYRALYRRGSYAPAWYTERITREVRAYAQEFGLSRGPGRRSSDPEVVPAAPPAPPASPTPPAQEREQPEQLELWSQA